MRSLTVLGLLAHALVALSQTASPTNSSIPEAILEQSQLSLSYGSLRNSYPIAYALDFASNNLDLANTSRARSFFVNGTIQLVTLSSIFNLTNTSIAYVNCDNEPSNQSNANVQQVISLARERLGPENNQTGAIILYTKTSQWCNYSAPDSFDYTPVFVLPSPAKANAVYWSLIERPVIGSVANTQVRNINGQPFNPGNDQGSGTGMPQTPSTTVAMIILYSVTGIITLCFIVVIVTGALRARRHPERYGLVNLPGNAHQRRAKGIARAMLETIPIIKFGEKEPMKLTADAERGTELQSTALSRETSQHNDQTINGAPPPVPTSGLHTVDEAASSRAASSYAPATGSQQQNDRPWEVIPDDGLACSVCTEDFVKGQDLRVLPCNHKFHPECIDPWLLNVSGTCPLCRIDLRPPEDREETPQYISTADSNQVLPFGMPETSVRRASTSLPISRHSIFLSRHRMREATPMQRIRALRDFRNHRRNGGTNTDSAETNSTPPEAPSRSNRVSRLFGRQDNSNINPGTTTTAGTSSNAADTTNTTASSNTT